MKSLSHRRTNGQLQLFLAALSTISSITVFCSTLMLSRSIENIPSLVQTNAPNVENGTSPISVFYNVYTNSEAVDNAKRIVNEQMSNVRPEHRVFIRSIGVQFQVDNATHVQHNDEGWEVETLKLLWDHCVDPKHERDTVVYIHNKGSFHPSNKNDLLRRLLTRAALSEDCANMPPSCNVCSFRMSPLPHPHTPGNMWSAKCNYVKKLINPVDFEQKMTQFYHARKLKEEGLRPFEIGTDRYAAEHWVHSHPTISACDLSTSDFVWGYSGLPQMEHEMKLMQAPRYDRDAFLVNTRSSYWNPIKNRKKRWFHVDHRLDEYKFLYNETPLQTWFGWTFYNVTVEAKERRRELPHKTTSPRR